VSSASALKALSSSIPSAAHVHLEAEFVSPSLVLRICERDPHGEFIHKSRWDGRALVVAWTLVMHGDRSTTELLASVPLLPYARNYIRTQRTVPVREWYPAAITKNPLEISMLRI